MTNDQELSLLWRDLSRTYQLIASTTNYSEKQRLKAYASMLSTEYRSLTSRYQ